jgi:glycosyltransferase involved in cell wall biosynthesis
MNVITQRARSPVDEIGQSRVRVSIIVALTNEGSASGLRSWLEQDAPRDQFEIIAVDGRGRSRASGVELQADDRVVQCTRRDIASLFNESRRYATGGLVVFTTGGVVAEPKTVTTIINEIRATRLAAATLRWSSTNPRRRVAAVELFESEQLAHWSEVDPNERIRMHGFVATSEAIDAIGEWPSIEGAALEAWLGSSLRRMNIEVGLVGSHPLVRTSGPMTLRREAKRVTGLVRGSERAHHDAQGQSVVSDLRAMEREIATRVDVATPRRFTRDDDRGSATTHESGLALHLARLAAATTALTASSPSRRVREVRRFRQVSAQLAQPTTRSTASDVDEPILDMQGEFPLEVAAHRLRLHSPVESHLGHSFVWLPPFATQRFAMAAGPYVVHLDTAELRGRTDGLPVSVFWNGEEVPSERVTRNASWISVAVTSDGTRSEEWLTTVVAPLPVPGDASDMRELGLPLCRIRIDHVDHRGSKPTCPPQHDQAPSATHGNHPTGSGRARKILVVNTADTGGGAEVIASDVYAGYREHGLDSWFIVGNRSTTADPQVVSTFASPFVDYGPLQTVSQVMRANVQRRIGERLGHEDFVWPQTAFLTDMAGAPPDFVHLHNLHGGYFDLRALPELSHRIPTIFTLHDEWAFTGHCALSVDCERWRHGCGSCPALAAPPSVKRDSTNFNLRRKAEIYARSRIFVATPSQWLADRAQASILQKAIVDSRVIPNGVNLDVFTSGSKSHARHRLGLPQDDFIVAFAASSGAANVYKDFETLRTAMVGLAEQLNTPVHLVAAGQHRPVERLGRLVVHHLDRLVASDMALLYQAADVYAHATKVENHCLSIIEAMACGTPVVATDVGGNSEVIGGRQNGTLVPTTNAPSLMRAVADLADNSQRREQIASNAQRRARQLFDRTVMIQRYIDWFDEISEHQTNPNLGTAKGAP